MELFDRPFDELTARQVYGVLQLRSAAFVVEQSCVFLDADGVDLVPSCHILWIEDDDGDVVATARVYDDHGGTHIGRIVTDAAVRQQGLAGQLIDHAVATTTGPWFMKAQSRLAPYYARFDFVVDGAEFMDDGIPHVPMRRDA